MINIYLMIDMDRNTMISEPEKAWLACAYDSEGSIMVQLTKWNTKRARMVLYNTDLKYLGHAKSILERILNGYPVDILSMEHPNSIKLQHIIRIEHQERCREIIRQIRPYLIIKTNNADEILNIPPRLKFNLVICRKCNKLRRHSCFGLCRPCGPW